ncbi:MAG: hypothetical protein BJ554DRAFT_5698 [Olpidium bornovanus]|uniref:Uncharacterized protein n=1 Tax=Olpidium bornovanus TaxID=278681 RepID=A0A8H8A2F3_9FUNG|nr:MAG: hypothetical protein BJ554DRAFT_5698 [Olpidium bornovanus]
MFWSMPLEPPIFFIIRAKRECITRSSSTSRTLVPLPSATRRTRPGWAAKILPSESSSPSVMLSIMNIRRRIRPDASSSLPCSSSCGIPGIIPITLLNGPIFMMFCSWPRMSRM